MELLPLQVTQFPVLSKSCEASDNEPDLDASVASVLIKTKPVCCVTRAAWIFFSIPAPGPGSEEEGTRTTIRLRCTQSNTASSTAATNRSPD